MLYAAGSLSRKRSESEKGQRRDTHVPEVVGPSLRDNLSCLGTEALTRLG
jgi:hypothetical protein